VIGCLSSELENTLGKDGEVDKDGGSVKDISSAISRKRSTSSLEVVIEWKGKIFL